FVTLEKGCGEEGSFTSTPPAADMSICTSGSISLTYGADDGCTSDQVSATFSWTQGDAVKLEAPAAFEDCAFETQAELDAAFSTWLAGFKTLNNGCNATAFFVGGTPTAPDLVGGGTVNATYRIDDGCTDDEVSSSFTIYPNPTPSLNTSLVCEGDIATFTATPTGYDNYEFFLDANTNGVLDEGESLASGTSNIYSGVFTNGDVIGVLVTDANGCTAIDTATALTEACCFDETGYAYDGGGNMPFCGNIKSNNWGWSNGPYSYIGLDETLPLYAGASDCDITKGVIAGYVSLSYDSNTEEIVVVYQIQDTELEYFKLLNVQVYIGCDDLPRFAGSPGQYPYKDTTIFTETTAEIRVPLSDLEGKGQNFCPTGFWVIAHADVDVCEGERSEPIASSILKSSEENLSISSQSVLEEASFSVAPVPFKDQVSVRYDFEYTSDVKIQFFDLNGSLLRTYTDKQVSKGDETQINVDFALRANTVYIMRIETDRDAFSKNIMSGN
ncbi:T9SS type A sorting domain-containing protein, partial [Christiangramia aestuarii]|uniref:T9SS type A sorting domain-containing protein n=3 Tax=Christiangramia aestuarii TaxID=1028746 RepID=UPI0013913674